jgi:hypothetical protein
MTLAGRGTIMIGCAITGLSAISIVLLGVTIDGEKIRMFSIYKGGNTAHLKIKLGWKDRVTKEKYGYPDGQMHTVQTKAWLDETGMLDWGIQNLSTVPCRVCCCNCLFRDQFPVHLMGSVIPMQLTS